MGSKTASSSTTQVPSKELSNWLSSAMGTVNTAASTPYQAYQTAGYNNKGGGEYVAPINEQQLLGMSNINKWSAPVGESQINSFMNPYLNNVLGSTEALVNQQNQQQQAGQLGNAINQGAFGGDRAGIAAANLAGQQELAGGKLYSGIASDAYNNALTAAFQQQQAQMGAAEAQIGAGTLEQQTAQASDTALANQYNQERSYPFQTADFLTNAIGQLGGLFGGTSTTTKPGSLMSSDARLKKNAEVIGKTFDGQPIYKYQYKQGDHRTHIGLMAQDVEHSHPDAVGTLGGYKAVDYDKATKHAAERGHFYSGGLVPQSMGGPVHMEHMGEGYGYGGSIADMVAAHQAMYGAPGQGQGGGGAGGIGGLSGLGLGKKSSGPSKGLSIKVPASTPQPSMLDTINKGAETSRSIKQLGNDAEAATDWTKQKLGFNDLNTNPGAANTVGATSSMNEQIGKDFNLPSTNTDIPNASIDKPDISLPEIDSSLFYRGGLVGNRHGYATEGLVDDAKLDIPEDSGSKPASLDIKPGSTNFQDSGSQDIQDIAKIAEIASMFMASRGGVAGNHHGYASGGASIGQGLNTGTPNNFATPGEQMTSNFGKAAGTAATMALLFASRGGVAGNRRGYEPGGTVDGIPDGSVDSSSVTNDLGYDQEKMRQELADQQAQGLNPNTLMAATDTSGKPKGSEIFDSLPSDISDAWHGFVNYEKRHALKDPQMLSISEPEAQPKEAPPPTGPDYDAIRKAGAAQLKKEMANYQLPEISAPTNDQPTGLSPTSTTNDQQTGLPPPSATNGLVGPPAPAITPVTTQGKKVDVPADPYGNESWMTKLNRGLASSAPLLSGIAAAKSAPTRNPWTALAVGAGAAGQSALEAPYMQSMTNKNEADIGRIQAATGYNRNQAIGIAADNMKKSVFYVGEGDKRMPFILDIYGKPHAFYDYIAQYQQNPSSVPPIMGTPQLLGAYNQPNIPYAQIPKSYKPVTPTVKGASAATPPIGTSANAPIGRIVLSPSQASMSTLDSEAIQNIRSDPNYSSGIKDQRAKLAAARDAAVESGGSLTNLAESVNKLDENSVLQGNSFATELFRTAETNLNSFLRATGHADMVLDEKNLDAAYIRSKILAAQQFLTADSAGQHSAAALAAAAKAMPDGNVPLSVSRELTANMLIAKKRAMDTYAYEENAFNRSRIPSGFNPQSAISQFRTENNGDAQYQNDKYKLIDLLSRKNLISDMLQGKVSRSNVEKMLNAPGITDYIFNQ